MESLMMLLLLLTLYVKYMKLLHQLMDLLLSTAGTPPLSFSSSLLSFFLSLSSSFLPFFFPLSSAGVGRTGTFIALGTLLLHIKDHDWIDLFGLASEMRQHRNHMIQTEPQYVFIHKAMVEACQSRIGVKVLPSFNPIYSNGKERGKRQRKRVRICFNYLSYSWWDCLTAEWFLRWPVEWRGFLPLSKGNHLRKWKIIWWINFLN